MEYRLVHEGGRDETRTLRFIVLSCGALTSRQAATERLLVNR